MVAAALTLRWTLPVKVIAPFVVMLFATKMVDAVADKMPKGLVAPTVLPKVTVPLPHVMVKAGLETTPSPFSVPVKPTGLLAVVATMIFEAVLLRCTATGKVSAALVVISAPSLMIPLFVRVNVPIGTPAVPIGLFKTIFPTPAVRVNGYELAAPTQEAPPRVIVPPLELMVRGFRFWVTGPEIVIAPVEVAVIFPLIPIAVDPV